MCPQKLSKVGIDSAMSTTSLPFTEVAGQKLTGEQSAYLEGLFAGLRNRGLSFADVEPNPAGQPAKAAAADLIFEERVKRELHPLDAYPVLLEHAAANKAPDKETIFRFKWNGLFYLTPNKEAFMARLRIPGGQLQTFQLREIARVAQELTSGYVQITTRANLQIRLIEPKNAPEVLRRIQSVGLHTRGAGADNIRNLTANPTAGIDPHELIDTLPLCQQLAQIILNDRSFYDLPRKFNIAFDGGGLIGTVEDTNDIGLKAVRVSPSPLNGLRAQPRREISPSLAGVRGENIVQVPQLPKASANSHPSPSIPLPVEGRGRSDSADSPVTIKPGIYFRISVGGATGHKAFARDLGVLVKPDEVLKVTTALIRVYIANGNRGDRKKARLKHLLETWSLEKYLEEAERLLGYQLPRSPISNQQSAIDNRQSPVPHSHIGVFPQKQPGLNYIGVAVPVGQITPKQMLRLAEIADLYGSSEVRLTVWQNLVIPNIPDAFLETVKKALVKMGLHWQQSNLRSGIIACTGNSYCKFASANTKSHAIELADYLDKRIKLDQPINIHLTGCPNSCAQHYMGDIGLLGTKVKVAGESFDGYHVFVGGGFGERQAVGRQIFQGVSCSDLKPTLEKMFKGYLRHRKQNESFQSFTNRHDVGALQGIFSNDE
jgi:ferredoxin-nitrite reductase